MNRPIRTVSIALVAACVAARPASRPTTRPLATLSPAEQVQFQQRTVEAQVQELQDRMYHLADLTRSAEPDDSARLLMAVRKARQDLLVEQVRDVLDQLARQDFGKAADGQQQVLVKLEQLKRLLTSTDLDMQMQLDRLKALTAAIAKLDKATKEQNRLAQKSTALAAKPGEPKAAAAAKADQQQNHKATEAIAQTVKDLGAAPAAAAQTLGAACQDMALAEGQLGNGSCASASPSQASAAEQMKKARAQLEAERQKVLEQLASQVRKQVVENLQEMLDRQKSVRGATAAIVSAGGSAGDAAERAGRLSPAEAAIVRINDSTLELIEQTEFSVALPPELRAIGRSCQSIGDRLAAGGATTAVVADEKAVERDLADLLATFKELSAEPGEGSCRGCKGNKNKLLAELRVVRLMQQHVNRLTAEADVARGDAPLTDAAQADIHGVATTEADVRDAAEAIHQELSGE